MNKRTIRVVIFREAEFFVAQALEVDISAQGRTPEEASRRLGLALNAEQREAEAEGRDLFEIGPAPESFRVLFEDRVVSREEKLVA